MCRRGRGTAGSMSQAEVPPTDTEPRTGTPVPSPACPLADQRPQHPGAQPGQKRPAGLTTPRQPLWNPPQPHSPFPVWKQPPSFSSMSLGPGLGGPISLSPCPPDFSVGP